MKNNQQYINFDNLVSELELFSENYLCTVFLNHISSHLNGN